jgi:glycosyltransferase involved in cell wall biosynthesis
MAMHAILALDRERLRTEHAQFGRLVVALTANGCRITTLLFGEPFGNDHPADRPIGLGRVIHYPENIAPWLRAARFQELFEQFDRDPPDLFWAAGIGSWAITARLARELKRPLVVQIDGQLEMKRAKRLGRLIQVAGFIASTEPFARQLARDFPKSELELVPPGIAIREREVTLKRRSEDGPLALSILGNSKGRGHYRALFEALSNLREVGPGARFAIELPDDADQRIWRQLRRSDLTDLTTAISEPVRMQRLLAASDLILRPVPEHRVRPIILEAMARGAPVVTVPEPWLDYLGPDQGSTLVERPTSQNWEEALRPLLLSPELRTTNGTLAREWVITRHRSSDRAQAVESLFTRVVGEESLPLQQPEEQG